MKRPRDEFPAEFKPPVVPGCSGMALFLAFIAVCLLGLTIGGPFYIVWPRRYPGMTWLQSVAVRAGLVWLLWSRYVFGQLFGLWRSREPGEGRP